MPDRIRRRARQYVLTGEAAPISSFSTLTALDYAAHSTVGKGLGEAEGRVCFRKAPGRLKLEMRRSRSAKHDMDSMPTSERRDMIGRCASETQGQVFGIRSTRCAIAEASRLRDVCRDVVQPATPPGGPFLTR